MRAVTSRSRLDGARENNVEAEPDEMKRLEAEISIPGSELCDRGLLPAAAVGRDVI